VIFFGEPEQSFYLQLYLSLFGVFKKSAFRYQQNMKFRIYTITCNVCFKEKIFIVTNRKQLFQLTKRTSKGLVVSFSTRGQIDTILICFIFYAGFGVLRGRAEDLRLLSMTGDRLLGGQLIKATKVKKSKICHRDLRIKPGKGKRVSRAYVPLTAGVLFSLFFSRSIKYLSSGSVAPMK